VPSASTRPNRCGSLRGAGVTWWLVGPAAAGRGPGRGPGRGTGAETGGAESSILGSSAVMRSSPTLCTSARPITAHPPRSAAPCGRADWYYQAPSTGTTVFKSIQAAWRAVCGHLAVVVGARPGGSAVALSGDHLGFCAGRRARRAGPVRISGLNQLPVRWEPGGLGRITKRFHHRSTHMAASRRPVTWLGPVVLVLFMGRLERRRNAVNLCHH
jgi:hypothetical protein